MLSDRRRLSTMSRLWPVVARSYEVFNARDFGAYPELLHEDVEFVMSGIVVRGLAAVTDFVKETTDARPGLRIDHERVFVEAGDTIVTEVRMSDTAVDPATGSGAPAASLCGLYRVTDGRIAEWRVYQDPLAEDLASAALMTIAAEQSALRRVAELVARHAPADEVFDLVTEELSRLLNVDIVRTVRFEPDGTATILASRGTSPALPPGMNVAIPRGTIVDQVLRTGRPARVERYERVPGPVGDVLRTEGARSAAGGPVLVDGRVWGAMVVGFSTGEPPPAGAEQRVAEFAELVSTAISNVAAQAKVERLAAEQSALQRVATLVARQHSPADLFATLARELGELLAVDAAAILRYEPDATVTAVAGWSAGPVAIPLGARLSLTGDNLASQVRRSGLAQRKDDYANAAGEIASTVREQGIRSAVASPITVAGDTWGVIAVLSRQPEPLPADTEVRLAEFSRHAAMAVANANSRAALAQSRARIVRAGDEARRRFERDLHDGAQQRLVSLGLELRTAESIAPAELGELRGLLAHVSAGLGDVLEDLRELSRGLHPAALTEGGLAPALRSLSRRSAVPVDLQLELDAERLAEPVEVAAYYTVSEALANTAKHAGATHVRVRVSHRGDALELTVTDDGRGGADPATGSGLTGLADRLEALGGSVRIDSPPGTGTTVSARLPISVAD